MRPRGRLVNLVRVATFLLLASVSVAAHPKRRVIYLCDVRTQPLPWKNPFAPANLFEPQLLGAYFNISKISPPEEFRVHDLRVNASNSHVLMKRPEPCRPIYGDVDARGGISFH